MTKVLRIKPVAKGYFKTSKITLRDIAMKRRAGVVMFATRANPDGSETDVFLIPEPGVHVLTEGKFCKAEHMNTGRKYGDHQVKFATKFSFKNGVLRLGSIEPGTALYSQAFDLEAVAFEMV